VSKKVVFSVLIVVAICVTIYLSKKKKTGDAIQNFQGDYEGDNYEGSKYYVGDKNFYQNDKGRSVANAVPSSLYKVVEPAYKLKHEFNDKGVKTLIKISHDGKHDLQKGSQIRIIKDSEQKPLSVNGNDFVQTIYGNFVRMDKVKKVRD